MSVLSIDVMKDIKSIKDVEVRGKRVLIRVDFNVPINSDLDITDDRRIRESIPTINYCIDAGAKSIILVSHLGRPKGMDLDLSLRNILKRVERLLNRSVCFATKIEDIPNAYHECGNGAVILLENIRFLEAEEKNEDVLARKLANLCDVYVNDAFGTSHRRHASMYGAPKYAEVKVAGLLLKKEIDGVAKVLNNPLKPVLLIVGGAKVSSKLSLLDNILDLVDKIIIGGAMGNTFLKAIGFDMQLSLTEDHLLEEAKNILRHARSKEVKIYLPVDLVCVNADKDMGSIKIVPAQDVPSGYMSADIGPASIKLFAQVVRDAQTVIWNGPHGIYETPQFSRGTFNIARALADTYAYSFIGGGDTADALRSAGEIDNMSFISTGGGASLELLEGKVLPAFEVLDRRKDSLHA